MSSPWCQLDVGARRAERVAVGGVAVDREDVAARGQMRVHVGDLADRRLLAWAPSSWRASSSSSALPVVVPVVVGRVVVVGVGRHGVGAHVRGRVAEEDLASRRQAAVVGGQLDVERGDAAVPPVPAARPRCSLRTRCRRRACPSRRAGCPATAEPPMPSTPVPVKSPVPSLVPAVAVSFASTSCTVTSPPKSEMPLISAEATPVRRRPRAVRRRGRRDRTGREHGAVGGVREAALGRGRVVRAPRRSRR